jgi:hypothetical protein
MRKDIVAVKRAASTTRSLSDRQCAIEVNQHHDSGFCGDACKRNEPDRDRDRTC